MSSYDFKWVLQLQEVSIAKVSRRWDDCREYADSRHPLTIPTGFFQVLTSIGTSEKSKLLPSNKKSLRYISFQSSPSIQSFQSVSTFLGRPNFIIFSSRSQLYDERPKNFVDVNFLMRKAMIMLEKVIIRAHCPSLYL